MQNNVYYFSLGLWYTGNTPPWHGGVRGPIPLRSTKFMECQVRIFEIPLRSTKRSLGDAGLQAPLLDLLNIPFR